MGVYVSGEDFARIAVLKAGAQSANKAVKKIWLCLLNVS